MGGIVNQNDNFGRNDRKGDLPSGAASLAIECARLREDLALSRQELAQVRLRQEDNEEQLVRLSMMEAERDNLAKTLARHLSNPSLDLLQIGGVRGWLARRVLGSGVLHAKRKDPLVALIEESGLFDAGWYLRTYSDVADAGECPAIHYLYHGAAEGRAASPRFDTAFYLARYPEVRESGVNPLVHYLQSGRSEGRLAVQPSYERAAFKRAAARPEAPPQP
jgi:hypothetical protein